MRTTLTGTATTGIVLGSGGYNANLLIADTGVAAIEPPGGAAITAPAALGLAVISNYGTIGTNSAGSLYAYGQNAPAGGDGLIFAAAAGRVDNAGNVYGGSGGDAQGPALAGAGGVGILLQSAVLARNTGHIYGGVGGNGYLTAADGGGGAGVALAASGAKFANAGVVFGGAGGSAPAPGLADGGAAIATYAAALVANSGTLGGGNAGFRGTGGAGVAMSAGGVLHNTGAIYGGGVYFEAGTNGGAGVVFGAGQLSNSGFIGGGAGGQDPVNSLVAAGSGGDGLQLGAGATAVNSSVIAGGSGGNAAYYYGGSGGAGVIVAGGATLVNQGTVDGGNGGGGIFMATAGGSGGVGVYVQAGGRLVNSGYVLGGSGGAGPAGGAGGVGVRVDGSVTNTGTIAASHNPASAGAYALRLQAGQVSNAGSIVGGYATVAAVDLVGGVLKNVGTIIGGGNAMSGGAAGVILAGGTLVTSGTIDPGAGGSVAVLFSGAATLEVSASAVFGGSVQAQPGAGDQLLLGPLGGTFSGLDAFSGFASLGVAAGAAITVTGSLSASTADTLTFGGSDRLTLLGGDSIGSTRFTGPQEKLVLASTAQFASTISGFAAGDTIDLEALRAHSAVFANGTLTLYAGTNGQGGALGTLDFAGTYAADAFAVRGDGVGGTFVRLAAAPAADAGWRPSQGGTGGWSFEERLLEPGIALHFGR